MIDEKKLVELEVSILGAEALQKAETNLKEAKASGIAALVERAELRIQLVKEQLKFNESERDRRTNYSPNENTLFGGVSNIKLPVDAFEICDGLTLESCFAHVMNPYIVAFSPADGEKPHPGPWKSAGGGSGFDINCQIALAKDCRPTGFDRLNTIWWITSLLRLQHSTGIRTPVISDTSFHSAASSKIEPIFLPMEVNANCIAFDGFESTFKIPVESLDWIRDNFVHGAELMDNQTFNLAYRALETSHNTSGLTEAYILIWSALEALLRPGATNITHKISLAIATYLEPDPSTRDKLYGVVKRLYGIRGRVTHAAEPPRVEPVTVAFEIARACFMKAIRERQLPDFPELESNWKSRK